MICSVCKRPIEVEENFICDLVGATYHTYHLSTGDLLKTRRSTRMLEWDVLPPITRPIEAAKPTTFTGMQVTVNLTVPAELAKQISEAINIFAAQRQGFVVPIVGKIGG